MFMEYEGEHGSYKVWTDGIIGPPMKDTPMRELGNTYTSAERAYMAAKRAERQPDGYAMPVGPAHIPPMPIGTHPTDLDIDRWPVLAERAEIGSAADHALGEFDV